MAVRLSPPIIPMLKKSFPVRPASAAAPMWVSSDPDKGRCFIVQEPLHMVDGVAVPRIGYHTIVPYGSLKFLFSWSELSNANALGDTTSYLDRLYQALQTFSDRDYIVPLGNPALVAMAMLVASEVNYGRVKMLDWIRDERRYRIVQIDLSVLDAALQRDDDDDDEDEAR